MRELRFRAVRPNRSIARHLNVILQPEHERALIASGAKSTSLSSTASAPGNLWASAPSSR
jgi:hypothetical protein